MRQAIFAPTEDGYDVAALRRAVLTYDKIFILEPGDRDLFPPNALMAALGMPMVGMDQGPVRPLGTSPGYAERFESLIEKHKPLIKEGVVEIISTWNRDEIPNSPTIGAIPLGGYPLNINLVYEFYREYANNQNFLQSSLDNRAVELAVAYPNMFELSGGADMRINDNPELPLLEGILEREALRSTLTLMARSRIATALKTWGLSEFKDAVPLLPSSSANMLDAVFSNVREAIDAKIFDPAFQRQGVILDIIINEQLHEPDLLELTSAELLSLRTSAMAEHTKARTTLFQRVAEMAEEPQNLDLIRFREKVASQLQEFRARSAKLQAERQKIAWKIFCDVGAAGLKTSATGIIGTAISGMVHTAAPFAPWATVALAGHWALEKAKQTVPDIKDHLEAERQFKTVSEFGVIRSADRLGFRKALAKLTKK